MNIGFDAKRYFNNFSGLGNYSRDLIRMMEEYYPNNSYHLYTPKINSKVQIPEKNNIHTHLPKNFFDKLIPDYWRSKSIVRDLVRDKIELFHGLSGEIPRDIHKSSIKSIVTIHDLIFLRYPELYRPIDRQIYYKKFKYATTHAQGIIAISEQTKSDIIEFLHVPAEKIQVIYQGCHTAFKRPKTQAEKDDLLKRLNLPNTFILNVGTVEPRKNALNIIQAIKDIDIPLVIVGRPNKAYYQKIQQYICTNKMENSVFFLTGLTMDELAIIYSAAKAFVYPSKFEGFGIPIIEALYSGTPVITTNAGVFPEAAGPNSCFIDPENIAEFSHAIDSVLASESRQSIMKEKGLLYVKKFNDDFLANQLHTYYKTILY